MVLSTVAAPIFIPTNNAKGFIIFSTSSPAHVVYWFICGSLSGRCEVIAHWGFGLHALLCFIFIPPLFYFSFSLCYGLNVFPLNFIYWSLDLPCNGILKLGLWEIIRVTLSHEGGVLMMESLKNKKRGQSPSSLHMHTVWSKPLMQNSPRCFSNLIWLPRIKCSSLHWTNNSWRNQGFIHRKKASYSIVSSWSYTSLFRKPWLSRLKKEWFIRLTGVVWLAR